jgi:L-cysteine:1D-myo-inositol 2-amino-2-deoxy-alpha-D-glucopyranoside ligase
MLAQAFALAPQPVRPLCSISDEVDGVEVTVRLFCTQRRALAELPASDPINIYVCGVTPYDSTHLGHVATFLTYDILARRLVDQGRDVRLVRNITDVDDPILERVLDVGADYWTLVESEIAQFTADMRALNAFPAGEPRVSESLAQVIEAVEELVRDGHAYVLGDTVYFDVSRVGDFGQVSCYSPDQMLHLARERGGDPDRPGKRNRLDFILWQPSRPGEPMYESPFGAGRPGWHIGCSVMSRQAFGTRVDVHGGGADLIFPHHECEHAQNVALAGGTSVGLWVHTRLVSYQGEKMSKSLGNIVLARDLLKVADPRAVRLAVLRRYQHRYECEWRDEDLYAGVVLLTKLLQAARRASGPDPRPFAAEFRARLDDDLDLPGAIRQLELLTDATLADGGSSRDTAAAVVELAGLVGVPLDRAPAS